MKNQQLTRFQVEKIANRLLPQMLDKNKNNSIEFSLESLGATYEVEYGKDRHGHWVFFSYVCKENSALAGS